MVSVPGLPGSADVFGNAGAAFTDRGSVVEVFTDLSLWAKIKHAIDSINANTAA